MGLRINTNVASVNAQRRLLSQQRRLEHAQAAMSGGSRIVTAADDAAGLAISENIRVRLWVSRWRDKTPTTLNHSFRSQRAD